MSQSKRALESKNSDFDSACSALETILSGPARSEILENVLSARSFDDSLRRLRDGVRSHRFRSSRERIELDDVIGGLDRRTREDGFHVLQDWDGKADKLNEETIPVDVLDFMVGRTPPEAPEHRRGMLAILLDYYFFYALALSSLRIWDAGSADDNLDRLNRLVGALQGPAGSGQKFVANAETLVPIATSHFEPDIRAFELLLGKVEALNEPHRLELSLAYSAILASHLRFGFEATYARDIVAMRKDNVPDYPWLSFALGNLMAAYSRLRRERIEGPERERIVEGLVNGLSPDPRAFVGAAPPSLTGPEIEGERVRFGELFVENRQALLAEFERHRPSEVGYFPLALFFNFPHNVLKGIVVDSLLRGVAGELGLNDLLTGVPQGSSPGERRRATAETLMGYARSSPDRIRDRWVPAILYDARAGRRAFADTIRRL
jgi:hypothetical protein